MIVILLSGMGGVVHFVIQGKYYKLLLIAEGKSYINTSFNTIISILINFVKILLIILGYNIVMVQLSYFVITILQVVIFQIYIKNTINGLI